MEKLEPLFIADKNKRKSNGAATTENSLVVPQQIKCRITKW